MRETFTKAELEIITFESEDIVTNSTDITPFSLADQDMDGIPDIEQ